MKFSNRMRAGIALAACAAVGAAGGIAGSAAAPSKTKTKSSTAAGTYPSDPAGKGPGHRGGPHGGPGGPGGAVHSEEVVLNKAGTAFITETEDNGKVKSVSGSDVTITEAIGTVTYKDVTVTLPAGAKIERNGKTAAVGDLKAGDHIHVSQSSDGTFVFAADASFKPMRPGPGRGGGPRPGGPPPGGPTPP
jgi:hypothetical protein